jgi:hypothetical protein
VKQLCEHYKLHHIKVKDVIDEAIENLVSSLYDDYVYLIRCSFLLISLYGQAKSSSPGIQYLNLATKKYFGNKYRALI